MDFVKEGKLDEEKNRRQAEWERVRSKEDPIGWYKLYLRKLSCILIYFSVLKEAPPEVFDNRTLYDKLKEQHEIKKKEFEDTYSMSNYHFI
jgi:hypothetical protein